MKMTIVVMPYIEDNRDSCPRCNSKEWWSKKVGYCSNCRYIQEKGVTFEKGELSIIETALQSWIKDYYKEGTLAYTEKVLVLNKIKSLIEKQSKG